MTTNELMETAQNCQFDWPFTVTYPYQQTQYVPYQQLTIAPTVCSGDMHVFPCPHCEKCKCGKATVRRDAKPTK